MKNEPVATDPTQHSNPKLARSTVWKVLLATALGVIFLGGYGLYRNVRAQREMVIELEEAGVDFWFLPVGPEWVWQRLPKSWQKGVGRIDFAMASGPKFSDRHLAQLSAYPTLGHLGLNNTSVSGAGFQQVKRFSNLESLWVTDFFDDIADADLEALRGLITLRELDLVCPKVTDSGLQVLESLPQLEVLGLERTRLTDEGLKHLRYCSALRELHLAETQITGAGLKHLTHLGLLQFLNLSRGPPLNEVDLACLAPLKHLAKLDLFGRITAKNSDTLHKLLPSCQIILEH